MWLISNVCVVLDWCFSVVFFVCVANDIGFFVDAYSSFQLVWFLVLAIFVPIYCGFRCVSLISLESD